MKKELDAQTSITGPKSAPTPEDAAIHNEAQVDIPMELRHYKPLLDHGVNHPVNKGIIDAGVAAVYNDENVSGSRT